MSNPHLVLGLKPFENSNLKMPDSPKTSSVQLESSAETPQDESLRDLLTPPDHSPGQSLQASPYLHQVGGHGQLKRTLNGQVLKPMCEKELRFYSYIYGDHLPTNLRWLRHTTPKFYGKSEVPASPIRPSDSAPALLKDQKPRASLQWRFNSISMDVSPWSATMGQRLRKKKSSHRENGSIALEDLNQSFIFPCVLDVKIGTRHYDDDATEDKRRRHTLKAQMTTSAKYGVRFTGMQSYKRWYPGVGEGGAAGVLDFRDKYYGRRLKGEDLVPEATWFFDNGVAVRTDCIRIILEKLRYIHGKVACQKHFKFYSSSLLLVYEGASSDIHPCQADVRMIDFAHTQWVEGETEPDDGYVFGIENLIRILKEVIREYEGRDDVAHNHDGAAVREPGSSRPKEKGPVKAALV